MTKISVCITTYKRAIQLDQTLQSLAAQTRMPDELIISDDCSPDETAAVVERWRKEFPDLRYNRNPTNLKMPGNLNAAIGLARFEYIANLHDADTFDPHLLEEWEKALDSYPSAGFVFCGIAGWPVASESENGVILHDVAPLTNGRQFYERYFRHRYSSIVWGTVMARRDAYERLLPFDAAFGFISDVDMWMRMCMDYDVAYVRKPLIVLEHETSYERKLGQFNWNWLNIMRLMQQKNLTRFYSSQPKILQREMNRHRWLTQQVYARRLLGRLYWRDTAGLKLGLRSCRNLDWPLKALGWLVND
ncbi:MAG TPA: hypothetical protein DCL15_06890 [Chloroflexi bacterium]|nr:hypothetical protein [Chloroflexota bacterium]HHW87786.1 glycosyltransferase family 2 protein [Chloroflexota bacterium]